MLPPLVILVNGGSAHSSVSMPDPESLRELGYSSLGQTECRPRAQKRAHIVLKVMKTLELLRGI